MALNIHGVDVISGLGIPLKPLIPKPLGCFARDGIAYLVERVHVGKGYQTTLPLALTHCGKS